MKNTTTASPSAPDPRRGEPIVDVRQGKTGNLYGSRQLSEEILAVCRQPVRATETDKQYIQAMARSRGRSGEQDVRDFSARQFGRQNAELEGQVCHLETVLKMETACAERHCVEFSAKLEQTPAKIIHHREGQPWTTFTKVMVVMLLVLSVAGLAMGINTTATVLMASGIPAFENPVRAYCFSMVPILLAVIIKCVGSLFEAGPRRNYTLAVCVTGVFLGIVWAASFAKTFPGLTQSAADIVQSVTAATSGPANESNSGWMIFISILTEAFCSAGCWLMVQVICDRHQKTIVEPNPTYESLQTELDAWGKRRNENRRLAGQLAGKLNAIADARKHFTEDCVGHFHAMLKMAADNDDLKEFLNR